MSHQGGLNELYGREEELDILAHEYMTMVLDDQ